MWHLERELRATGNPEDIKRADIVLKILEERGSDIPLPGTNDEIYLIPPKEHGHLLTVELAGATKEAVEACSDSVLLEAMRHPIVEKRVYWQKELPEPPELWLNFYLSREKSERRFITQTIKFANLHISNPQTPYTDDPALLNTNLGDLREAALNGQLVSMGQYQSRALLEYVLQDYSPQS